MLVLNFVDNKIVRNVDIHYYQHVPHIASTSINVTSLIHSRIVSWLHSTPSPYKLYAPILFCVVILQLFY